MYIYIYIYTYKVKYTYVVKKTDNVPSRLSPQWLYGNSCIWVQDVRYNIYICFFSHFSNDSFINI